MQGNHSNVTNLEAMASNNLLAVVSNPEAMASNLLAMASNSSVRFALLRSHDLPAVSFEGSMILYVIQLMIVWIPFRIHYWAKHWRRTMIDVFGFAAVAGKLFWTLETKRKK